MNHEELHLLLMGAYLSLFGIYLKYFYAINVSPKTYCLLYLFPKFFAKQYIYWFNCAVFAFATSQCRN